MGDRVAQEDRSATSTAESYLLTVDTSVRAVLLNGTQGHSRWRVYGAAGPTACRYAIRVSNASGALQGSATAPTTSDLAQPTVIASPVAAHAYNGASGSGYGLVDGASTPKHGGIQLPADASAWEEILLTPGMFVMLYLLADGATTVRLEGPFNA